MRRIAIIKRIEKEGISDKTLNQIFKILKKLDKDGQMLLPNIWKFEDGDNKITIRRDLPYRYSFVISKKGKVII